MINVNEWLNNNYPIENRSNVTELLISELNLTGSLDLTSFTNLTFLNCSHNSLTELRIDSKQLAVLDCSNNQINKLSISQCTNLKELYSGSNEIEELTLPLNNQLEIINLADNCLESLNFSHLNPQTLKKLSIYNNNLVETNISVLSRYTNLTRLDISSDQYVIDLGFRNKFIGNLSHLLKELVNLKEFNCENTDLESQSLSLWELTQKMNKLEIEKEFIRVQRQDTFFNRITESNELIREDLNILRIRTPLQLELDLTAQLITKLANKQIPIEQRHETINFVSDLIGIKQMFLNTRSQNIENLKRCCNALEIANQNFKLENTNKALSIIGKVVESWSPLKIIEPFGNLVGLYNDNNQQRLALKSSDEFKSLLASEDNDLQLFAEVYQKVIKTLNLESKKLTMFTTRYQIYEVVTNLWVNKNHITVEDMKEAISNLQTNSSNLVSEVELQIELLQKEIN